ncbi:MAG: 3-isopropylmalate dehydratase small subunit [Spirochaetaceae bacterium]
MQGFAQLRSRLMPISTENIDTDQIIPARFLKVTNKDGLGKVAFCDRRYSDAVNTLDDAENAALDPEFVMNDERYAGAEIILAGDNFGCGSSREHAPWALLGAGFKAVISTSFADIFRSNALKNGLLPVTVSAELHHRLFELVRSAPGTEVTIDLETNRINLHDGTSETFPVDPFSRKCILQGVDQLGYLLGFREQIEEFERTHVVYGAPVE